MKDDEAPLTQRADLDRHRSANIRVSEALGGKYRIEGILGSGGMGTVLRAHHIQLDRPVAIKVMHSELLSVPDAARRFALEARATAALKSVHAVRILDIDRLPSGAPFIVMELLAGIDLATMVADRGPLTVDRAIHYLLQAADAIAEAHGQGIIHRDLKPQNMILTDEGIVKVVDFGLAKSLRPQGAPPESGRTATDVLVGSPAYMSPEQLRSAHIDERTDIWGLGVTLYHLLTGSPPFAAPNMQLLTSLIMSKEPPRVAERRGDVSPTVDAVITRCMRKNPDDRYATIAAFQGGLLHLRAELQSGSFRDTSVDSGKTSMGVTMGATLPATTRRNALPAEQEAASLPPPTTEPNPQSHAAPDDEPTQISMPLGDSRGGLGSTRKV